MLDATAPPATDVLRLLAVTRQVAVEAVGERRKAARQTLRNFGIDPDWTPGKTLSAVQRQKPKPKPKPKPKSKPRPGPDGLTGVAAVSRSKKVRRQDWLLAEIAANPGISSIDLHIGADEAGHVVHITTILNDLTALRNRGFIRVERKNVRHPGRYWMREESQ